MCCRTVIYCPKRKLEKNARFSVVDYCDNVCDNTCDNACENVCDNPMRDVAVISMGFNNITSGFGKLMYE